MTRTRATVIAFSISAASIASALWAVPASADEAVAPSAKRREPSAGSASVAGPRDQSDPLGAGTGAGYASRRPMPVPKPVPFKPPAEIAALAKTLAGTWSCKGNTSRGDGSSTPLSATVVSRLDLDNAWISTTLVERGGTLKWTEYRTYDPRASQWTRIQIANTTGHVISTSPGEQTGKWTWTGTASSPLGSLQLRDYEQKDGKSLKLWGEAQISGAWQKLYEVTCKK